MKASILLITIIMCGHVYAQTKVIQGKVTGTDGKAIAAANMILQNAKDSAVVKSELTLDDGTYKLSVDGPTNVILRATALGYTSQSKAVPTSENNPAINFSLAAEKTLKEVTVTSRKPVVEEKADRTVFNVENSASVMGGDALDALKKTPGVQVMGREVNIAGKSTASVMINGKLQQLSGNDLLQLLHSIPADNLSKIEVITSPPARYDAEGNSGIINLITKKNTRDGLRGSATGSFEHNSMSIPRLSTSLTYKKDKLNAFCNANVGRDAEKYTNRTTSYYQPERWDQSLIQYSSAINATAQVGADYRLSDKATVGAQITEGYYKEDDTDETISKKMLPGNILDSLIRTTGSSHDFYDAKRTINLNYEWRIDTTGKKLNVDADYYNQSVRKGRTYYTQGFAHGIEPGLGVDNKLNANPSITIKSIKADVELPLKALTLSFGGKAAFVENNADNIYQLFDGSDFVVDTTRTNSFSYKEQTQALYISAQKSKGNFEMQAGLRAEHTMTETNSPTTGLHNINDYTQLFPTAYVQYKINDNNVLSLNFSRRINRPGYNSLNPFRFYYGPNYYYAGNPNLRPSFNSGFELLYRWKMRYSAKLFGRQTDNYWDRLYQTDDATGETFTIRANIGLARMGGISINGQHTITKWWEARGSANVAYNYFALHHYNTDVVLDGVYEWFELNNTFFLNKSKTLTIELENYYYTPRRKDFKLWGEMSLVNISARWSLMNKNLVIAILLQDLMARAYWQQVNVINGTNEYSYDNARGGRISLTYKFGNKNVKTKSTDHSNEEIQRVN